ncbi:polysaccharide export outer membrane protein [Arcticibacter pallidicorallinus]|uniref:Polysaccharide export outer membrane protein n=1 Tax=Arcticibacter pallidicorallinus TaxID=1259464 RepID=A0A2T0UBQ1_9SPHI|nr:polysaccharide biosynthesis/export family protein [Arcticibacter pallidicorallinus]PRY55322.1 polysaccharide export outer membrane protein [Arcticibacter pallidicorallinus]
MQNIRTYGAMLIAIFLSSCSSYQQIPYYQDLSQSGEARQPVSNESPLTINPSDLLAINVTSKNPETATIFNYNLNTVNGSYAVTPDNPVIGYRVDEEGNIHLPLIGKIKVKGLTTTQLRDNMTKSLTAFYKDPVVNIRIINFKVAIYGDVLKPDLYTLENERTTVTQALSLAGDLNITAMRKNVLLVRTENGERKMVRLDLTSKNIFNSPYFYLKNNDEIYVQPDRTKFATVDRGYRTASLVLSGLSIIAIVLSNIYR